MAPRSPTPAYAERFYQVYDIGERIAESDGEEVALKAATDVLGWFAEGFPDVVDDVLGIGRRVGLQATFKASQAPDPVELAGERLVTALRAKMPDDQALAWLEQQMRALQEPAPGGMKVTSSGPQSVVATKAVGDPWQCPDFSDMRPR